MHECLKSAQDSLCIQVVNLKESKVFVRDEVELDSLDKETTVAQSFRSVDKIKEFSLVDPDNQQIWDYRFIYSVGVRLIMRDEEEASKAENYKPVVEIFAIFEAKYFSKKQLSEDEFKAYAIDNVGYHAWPYWREYVQSSCARVGLSPAFEVPVYILTRKDR